MCLENALVIFDHFVAVVRGGDDNMGAAREEAFVVGQYRRNDYLQAQELGG